jgi:uncharacterized protein (TIGR03382 family)
MKSRNPLLAILVCLMLMPGAAVAATYTVTNANDSGSGSLRWAINQANMTLGADTIEFNIPVAAGDAIIILPTQGYVITDPGTTIDGFSQPGSSPNTNPAPGGLNTQLMISIDGFGIRNGDLAVFAIETNDTTIKGLNVHSGPLYEISIGRATVGCARNRVQGCFLGTNIDGTLARPSGWLNWNPPMVIGVYLARRAADNYIGSDGDNLEEAAERNLISGEARSDLYLSGHGVFLDGSGGMVSNTTIAGNLIGTTPDPDVPLGNNFGVSLFSGVSSNTVSDNVIAGNNVDGIWAGSGAGSVASTNQDNHIHGNYIGINPNTGNPVPNSGDGIHLNMGNESFFIGSDTEGNLISANVGHGVYLMDSDHIIIQNNVLGLNPAQDATRSNGGDGIALHCSDISCCESTVIWQNRIHGSAGNGIGLYGRHTLSDIGPNTIDRNDGAGIYSMLPDDTNIYWGHNIEYNGGQGIELVGSSAQVDGNTINDNTGWGIANYPLYGGDTSPAGAGNDVVGTPTVDANDIDANDEGGIINSDCEPVNGTTLHINNTIGDNNSRPDVLQVWFGAVEIIDGSSPPPISAGGYTVTLVDLEMVTETGTAHDGGLWGPSGFDSTDIRTWFLLIQYRVDTAGTFHTHTPHTVMVTGPTGGTETYSFDGVDNDIDTCNTGGCSPAGILTGGQFRYQAAEVMTQTDSDGDGVADSADCAPFDPGYQGSVGGVPCDADSDGYCNDQITGGVKPSACTHETTCTPGLCFPTDCLDSDPAVNPGATEGPPGDTTCGDTLDNNCDGLTDLNDPNCPHCISDSDCDDGNICTTDTCDPATGCQTSFNTLPCDDGLYCNVGETCQAGACQGGSAMDCSSLDDQCNQGACDEAGDSCYADPGPKNGDGCDDSDPCTMNDTCNGGTCAGAPLDADSDTYVSDDCGGDDCDDGNGAVHPNAAEDCDDGVDNDCDGLTDTDDPACAACTTDDDCDDGNVCNGTETCVGGFCQPGTPPDCNDANPCTDDDCDPVLGCVNPNNTDPCDDSDPCTLNDTCANGTCSGDPLDADSDGYAPEDCGGDDCDDSDAAVNPDADEVCDDSVDNDCDGLTDSEDPACQGCPDLDGDGFASDACGGTDCDDDNAAVNPDAVEICTDGIDNNCNGDTDLEDDECKRPAGSCGCSAHKSPAPTLLLGLLGLLILRRRNR